MVTEPPWRRVHATCEGTGPWMVAATIPTERTSTSYAADNRLRAEAHGQSTFIFVQVCIGAKCLAIKPGMYDLFIDELKTDAADELMFRHIRADWQSYELGLMRSKWFDYRFMHPVVATFAYAKAFDASYRRHFRASFGNVPLKRVFKNYDVFRCEKTTIAGLWRGRQHADALGMPYDIYTDLALADVLRFWKQPNMPRPLQLYSAVIVEQVGAQWEELQAGSLRYSTHENYRTHRFCGTTAQLDHHEWLFAQAGKRANPLPIMKRFYEEDLIPFEKIEARYGDRAREVAGFKLAA